MYWLLFLETGCIIIWFLVACSVRAANRMLLIKMLALNQCFSVRGGMIYYMCSDVGSQQPAGQCETLLYICVWVYVDVLFGRGVRF